MAVKKTKKATTKGAKAPATGASGAVRPWPALEVFSQGEAARSRKKVENSYGKVFASKATDRLCQSLATVQSFALEAAAPQPRATVLEFAPVSVKAADVKKRAIAMAGAEAASGNLLLARRQTMRDQFLTQVAAIRAQLDRQVHPAFRAGMEAMAAPTVPSSSVVVCWLNGTMYSYLDPRGLREIAAEQSLKTIDLPRLLRADIDGTASKCGAPQFRKRFSVTGEHITVAVIDTEVDIHHPALAGRVIQKTNHTKERFGSPAPHGTAVAGIIASADKKFTGMAPGVTIANYKVLATDSSLNADDFGGAMALQEALEDGVRIANCSWGSGPASDGTGREAVACNNAWDLGMAIVKSAGNAGPGPSTLTSPADADGIIVVGATDRAGTAVQDYSSRGPAGRKPRPHLVAPGGAEFDGMHSCLVGGGFGDAGMGTSYAAPHVSGLAALLLAQDASLTPDALRDKLVGLCTSLPAGDRNVQGAGFISLLAATKAPKT